MQHQLNKKKRKKNNKQKKKMITADEMHKSTAHVAGFETDEHVIIARIKSYVICANTNGDRRVEVYVCNDNEPLYRKIQRHMVDCGYLAHKEADYLLLEWIHV